MNKVNKTRQIARVLVLLSIFFALTFTVGASGSKEAAPESKTAAPETTAAVPEKSKESKSVVITDQNGREVTVPQPVERVVTIPIPAASMMIALDGGADRLVGMHPKSKSALEEGILKEFYPEALKISSDVVGKAFMPNIEEMLSVNPDVVFQWGHRGDDEVQPLTNAGFNTILLRYGTQEYLEGWISYFGKILGKEEKAQKILDWHHITRSELEEKTSAIDESEKPRVMYFLRYLSNMKVAGTGTYNDFYLNFAGGKNVAGDMKKFVDVNEEQIIVWDPEIIFLNGFESALTPDDVHSNPKLADVSAVKNHKVYKIPLGGYRWDPPNQESPLMWKWLAMIMHPDKFSWDLRDEIRSNYEWIYGKVPTEEQLDSILRLEMNKDAANYERFK